MRNLLKSNYDDYLRLKAKYQGIPLEEVKEHKVEELPSHFIYLQEADFNKPIWVSYANDMHDIDKLVFYMPSSMQKFIKGSLPSSRDGIDKISLGVAPLADSDLPSLQAGKRLTCPSNTSIKEVI